jgi:hypothetical protein
MEENQRPTIWVVSELPIVEGDVPALFFEDLQRSRRLFVIEEHVAQGGAASMRVRFSCPGSRPSSNLFIAMPAVTSPACTDLNSSIAEKADWMPIASSQPSNRR